MESILLIILVIFIITSMLAILGRKTLKSIAKYFALMLIALGLFLLYGLISLISNR